MLIGVCIPVMWGPINIGTVYGAFSGPTLTIRNYYGCYAHSYLTSSLSGGLSTAHETIRKANNLCNNSFLWLTGAKHGEGCQL